MFGTAGLPHILMRFFTVADAQAARKSVFYATGFIGYFYILTFIIGFGAITFLLNDPATSRCGTGAVRQAEDLLGGTNMAAVHLANAVGGSLPAGLHLGCGLRHYSRRRGRAYARGRIGGQP